MIRAATVRERGSWPNADHSRTVAALTGGPCD